MSTGSALRILSLITIVTVTWADNVDITVTAEAVKVGDSVNITCKGSIEGTAVVGPVRQIRKKLTIRGTPYSYTVVSAGVIQAPFVNSQRYKIISEAIEYRDTLMISDMQLEDSGEYVCYFKPNGKASVEKSKTITSMHPAEDVHLESTSVKGNEIDVSPNAGIVVKCKVTNYHPNVAASAQIHVGDKDVTSQFTKTITENVTGEVDPAQQGGLVKVLYSSMLVATNFVVLPEYAGKQLKCVSNIGDSPVMKAMNIKMQGKPVIQCPRVVKATLNDMNGFNITCRVISTPRVSRNSVVWTWNTTSGNEESITVHKGRGHYVLNTVELSADTLVVTLKFNHFVKINHFRQYKLIISNSMGRAEAMTLVQSPVPLSVYDLGSRAAVSLITMALCLKVFYLLN